MLIGGDAWSRPIVPIVPIVPEVDDAERIRQARVIWDAAVPAKGTLAEDYLRSRCLHLPIPESVRFTSLTYGKRGPEYPVLVAAIMAVDGEVVGIQRTYINGEGTGKAPVPKPKLSLGRVRGGAIRLAPTSGDLLVCEGLEDGLTLQQELGRAVWAAAGASMMPGMEFPSLVESVAIGGDGDKAGREAALKTAEAFVLRGLRARVFFPIAAKDFNAELMEGARP